MARKTSYQGEMKDAVQVVGRNLPISRKVGRELAVYVKGKQVDRAISDLKKVAKGKLAVPYKRHNRKVPHRKGKLMSGRYPRKASLEIIKLLESLKSNAENKLLEIEDVVIVHAACQHGGIAWHYGRQRRRRRKLNHFELVGEEVQEKSRKKKTKKKEDKKAKSKKDKKGSAARVSKKSKKSKKGKKEKESAKKSKSKKSKSKKSKSKSASKEKSKKSKSKKSKSKGKKSKKSKKAKSKKSKSKSSSKGEKK